MGSYTRSGARRAGDQYQDLQSADVLVRWLDQPDAYHWVHLETMDGSLDDIQIERADGTRELLQVKFATDADDEWDWDHLTKQKEGKRGPLPSLLQKWKTSLDHALASGVHVHKAELITNCAAGPRILASLSSSGHVDFTKLPREVRTIVSEQLGGDAEASSFFAKFRFRFADCSLDALEQGLRQRFFRLGGTSEGWSSLMTHIGRWIDHKTEPSPDGHISLSHVREASLWRLPPRIPQGFVVPPDYVAPSQWSESEIESRLCADGDSVLVVTGKPGAGKSTYLSWLVDRLEAADVPVVRHHYFLSLSDTTARRTDWTTAAGDIIGQLCASYPDLVPEASRANARPERLRKFLAEAGSRRTGEPPLVVIVDGLDHVWRETGSEEQIRSLFDLLLPAPDGVSIVVGTQDIDVGRIPLKLREACPRQKWCEILLLNRLEVRDWLQYHAQEFAVPSQENIARRMFDDLADVFWRTSGGHPLILHYTLGAARELGAPITPERILTLPRLGANSSVAGYYRMLWDSTTPQGHQLLHLLAGFSWEWPREGLLRSLEAQAGSAQLEQAESEVRHLLGTSRVGVTAFHESLLVFVRDMPEHSDVVEVLRPLVVDWLAKSAPEYWRWRYELEERAKQGDSEPLLCRPNLDWCVDALASGRDRTETAEVVAASGWAALEEGEVGIATERHYLDAYLDQVGYAVDAVPKLLWLALQDSAIEGRELELKLFLSRMARATVEEIEVVSEVAFLHGHLGLCDELFRECRERWNAATSRQDRSSESYKSLAAVMPALIARSIGDSRAGFYRRYVSKHREDPPWCARRPYARALALCCAVGSDTAAAGEELRFLANHTEDAANEAVDEIVRLAWRLGFDPSGWVKSQTARRGGLYRCHSHWVESSTESLDGAPSIVSFLPVGDAGIGHQESTFVELARAHFFYCLACAIEGSEPANADGQDMFAPKVAAFLTSLRKLAKRAADDRRDAVCLGGAWFLAQLQSAHPPDVRPNDYDNRLVRAQSVAQIVIAVAQDLEGLHLAETGDATITQDVLSAAVSSEWTWERMWIAERVGRRLTMSDPAAATLLIERERARLQSGRDDLHTRADHYVTLAQFCHLHGVSSEEVRSLARLSARNLMGHGYHKDMVLFDLLGAICAAPPKDEASTLKLLRLISPVVLAIDWITDRDETQYLKRELADAVRNLVPTALPFYVRSLQRNSEDWVVETIFTGIAKSGPLKSPFETALASTLVHEEALTALQRRAEQGEVDAAAVLGKTLAHCGRQTADAGDPARERYTPPRPAVEDLPKVEDLSPEQLEEFVRLTRATGSYEDKHLASWTKHWASEAPDDLLDAAASYISSHGSPHETLGGEIVASLALERQGRGAAWDWLVACHDSVHGWSLYTHELSSVEWIWGFVGAHFKDRWLEFIQATSHPRWGSAGGAPAWSAERMVRYLSAVGEKGSIKLVLDAAFNWGAGLAADMVLPAHALVPHGPETPTAPLLLADRLDCPSRMVQERSCWWIAHLLADEGTRDATKNALLRWHGDIDLELRSCLLLLILHLSCSAHDASADFAVGVASEAGLVPSIGARLLLQELGDDGDILSDSFDVVAQHSGQPNESFPGVPSFESTVSMYLAPSFLDWADTLDSSGVAFSRQWQWEAIQLAGEHGMSRVLTGGPSANHHYWDWVDNQALHISDRLSVLLRSAYLRALHWAVASDRLGEAEADSHAVRAAVMADPRLWAVRPATRPAWWPRDSANESGIDTLAEGVGRAIADRLECQGPDADDVLLLASGPVGSRDGLHAEFTIRAFLQSAHGPAGPSEDELVDMPLVGCMLEPGVLFVDGTYSPAGPYAGPLGDWMVAPLSWRLMCDTRGWLIPERYIRGVFVPPSWLFPGGVEIETEPGQVSVRSGDCVVGSYRYWHDELCERHQQGAGSRAGCELVVSREWLDPHLAAGASLGWICALSVAERVGDREGLGQSQIVGTWLVGGSRIVRPSPWLPPAP